MTGLTASPFEDFLVRGFWGYGGMFLLVSGLLISLERGALPMVSGVFSIFLWFRGFSCCLFDIGLCFSILEIINIAVIHQFENDWLLFRCQILSLGRIKLV